MRRLLLLERLNAAVPALLRSDAVVGLFRAAAAAAAAAPGAEPLPAPWWDVEADVGLIVGLQRHGYGNFEAIRRDVELEAAFQVRALPHGCSST